MYRMTTRLLEGVIEGKVFVADMRERQLEASGRVQSRKQGEKEVN